MELIHFHTRLMNLANIPSKNFQYIYAAIFTDYLENYKPVITSYFQSWERAGFTTLQLIKSVYYKHYESSGMKQIIITKYV